MRNKTLLCLFKVMGIMSVLAFQPVAARQITFNVPDCPSGQDLTFSNNTLSCSGTTVPPANTPGNCSISSLPASSQASPLTAGTQVSLTAVCASGDQPVTYTWNIGAIQSALIVAPSSNTTYTVSPSNVAGPGTPFSVTVYTGTQSGGGGGSGTAPSGCSISQSPNTAATAVAAGTTVTLTASCSTGSAATSCTWNSGISSTSCSVNVAPSATTSYNVTANNQYGPATPVSTTVQISAINNNPNITNYCTNSDNQYNVGWPASGQVRPTTNGFGNQRVSFKITIPFTFSPALNINHLGFVHIAEVPGAAVTSRDMTVSRNPCDFQSGTYIYNAIGFGDTAPGTNFTVNNPNGYLSAGANFNLQSGDVVYVNIRNANGGFPSCPNSSCDILFDFATPNRY